MLIKYATYTLMLCAILFFGQKRNCSNELKEAGEGIYWRTSCTAKCLAGDGDRKFEECRDRCQSDKLTKASFPPLRKINENHDLIQVCRDDHSITLKVVLPARKLLFNHNHIEKQSPLQQTPNTSGLAPIPTDIREIYVINVSLSKEPIEMTVYLSNDHFITIDNLLQNTSYNISVVVVYSCDEYSIIAKSRQFTTLRRGYKPKEIPEISLLKFDADEADEMRVTALIAWTPSHDMTCHYDLICYSPEREDMEVTPIEIRNPQSLYTYVLNNLTFDTVYNVGIRAKNTNDSSKESDLAWKKIKTPTCIEWHHNNFNICAPLTPEGLAVEDTFLAANEFSLNITWNRPKFDPDYYTLKVLDLDHLNTFDVKSHVVNVTKEQTSAFIAKLHLTGMLFEVHLTAYTIGGTSTAMISSPTKIRLLVNDKYYVLKLIAAILAPIICIAILSLLIFIICHRRAKLKRYQERCKYFEELEKKAPIDPKSTFDFPTKTLTVPPTEDDLHKFQLDLEEKLFFNDDMEINRSDVTLYEVLGEGAFGLVRRGIYRNSKHQTDGNDDAREVAVKMLKDQPSVDDVRAFRREIEVMKSVGYHPNIVGLIGHCTRKYNEMLLLTEYCSFGNLLNFLRNEWKYLHELSFRCVDEFTQPPDPPHKTHPLSGATRKHREHSSENVFNLDSAIVEKIKRRYKNINSASSNGSAAYIDSPATRFEANPKHESYGYDEICTNACKHRVDIVTEKCNDDGTSGTFKCGQIKISNKCECKLKRIKILSIDNEGYYKNLGGPKVAGLETEPGATEGLSNEEKVLNDSIPTKREPLTAADLLDIAKQVAMGMEFLSKNKVVHRDLAARNVLVSSDRTVKIADFGLSRDVYQENVYKKTGCGKLPIKWLALESMTHQVYTSQSDVWSYGILLYEIATLGGTPYPSIPTNRLLHLLKSGYRMERPKNCGQAFYNLMSSCWNINPAERPTFTKIIWILDYLLNEAPDIHIEQLIRPKQKNSPESPASDDSYLKPL